MRKIVFTICLLSLIQSIKLFAQPTSPSSCRYTGGMVILDGNSRIANFRTKNQANHTLLSKFEILDGLVKGADQARTHPDSLEYKLSTLLELIKTLNNVTACSGVRVYFGAYCITDIQNPSELSYTDTNINKLVPIFVPTVNNGDKENNYKDAQGNYVYYFMTPDNKVIQLSTEAGHAWISNYQQNVLPQLNSQIGDLSESRGDTKFLWYNIKELNTLQKYFANCYTSDQLANFKLYIKFAVFDIDRIMMFKDNKGNRKPLNVSNQLTMVFHIPDVSDKMLNDKLNVLKDSSLSSKSIFEKYYEVSMQLQKLEKESQFIGRKIVDDNEKKKIRSQLVNFKNYYLTQLSSNDFDTGNPCPPYNDCFCDDPTSVTGCLN